MIGYICKSSENLSFTVNRFQKAEITLIFVPTSIFAFSYTTAFNEIDLVFIVLHTPIIVACNKAN